MKLYPPYIEGKLPAFQEGQNMVIPYSMNPTVGMDEVSGFSVMIKSTQTNEVLAVTEADINNSVSEIVVNLNEINTGKKENIYKFENTGIKVANGTYGSYLYKDKNNDNILYAYDQPNLTHIPGDGNYKIEVVGYNKPKSRAAVDTDFVQGQKIYRYKAFLIMEEESFGGYYYSRDQININKYFNSDWQELEYEGAYYEIKADKYDIIEAPDTLIIYKGKTSHFFSPYLNPNISNFYEYQFPTQIDLINNSNSALTQFYCWNRENTVEIIPYTNVNNEFDTDSFPYLSQKQYNSLSHIKINNHSKKTFWTNKKFEGINPIIRDEDIVGGPNRFPNNTIYEWRFTGELGSAEYPSSLLLTPGQYYKIQIAYKNQSGEIGYYSTVGIIKYCKNNTLNIQNFNQNKINAKQEEYIGVFTSTDNEDKIKSYSFNIYDNNNQLIESSGDLFYDNSQVEFSNNYYIYNLPWKTFKNLIPNFNYRIILEVNTITGLRKSVSYLFKQTPLIASGMEELKLIAINDFENGCINLSFTTNDEETIGAINALFRITRSSEKDGYETWVPLTDVQLISSMPYAWTYKDYTVEQGITYKYAWQQYNTYKVYSERQESQKVLADFEDMFLFDGIRQLRMRFNPKITSFKTSYLEQKTDSIGNKYPFIFRNGNVAYKEFPYSGLISFLIDDNETFISKSEILRSYDNNSRHEPAAGGITERTAAYDTNLTSNNITSERLFKLQVLDWLNDGQPKLFRTPTEGNYLVRLMNNSLAPDDKLGRMLHTVSGTAYEIGATDYDTLTKLGIINTEQVSLQNYYWKMIECDITTESIKGQELLENQDIAYTLLFEDWPQGTVFKYKTTSGEEKEIEIGYTNKLEIGNLVSINSLKISNLKTSKFFKPKIIYSYMTNFKTNFDEVVKIEVKDIPIQQFRTAKPEGEDIIATILGTDNNIEIPVIYFMRFYKEELEENNNETESNKDIYSFYINYINKDSVPFTLTNERECVSFDYGYHTDINNIIIYPGVVAEIGYAIIEKTFNNQGGQ